MHDKPLHPETVAVVAGRPAREAGAPLNEPMTPASTFHEGVERGYGRDGNPGWQAFEDALGALEHGHAVAFASGLAAATAVMDEIPSGARVIAQTAPYFGVSELFRERARRGLLTYEPHEELTVEGLRP